MPMIPVTEYRLPNGARFEGYFDRPVEIANLAQTVMAAGFRFTVERLQTGEISLAVEDDDGDLDIEIVLNQPGKVAEGFDRLVKRVAAMDEVQNKGADHGLI